MLIGGNSILNEVNFVARSVLDEYEDASGKLDELKIKQAELLKVFGLYCYCCHLCKKKLRKSLLINSFIMQRYHYIRVQTV